LLGAHSRLTPVATAHRGAPVARGAFEAHPRCYGPERPLILLPTAITIAMGTNLK
jgi:hypothetical protein